MMLTPEHRRSNRIRKPTKRYNVTSTKTAKTIKTVKTIKTTSTSNETNTN